MGDDGFLVNASARIRRHNPVGDYLLIHGEVIDKEQVDGQGRVKVSQYAENQDGELSVEGTATIALPSRDANHTA